MGDDLPTNRRRDLRWSPFGRQRKNDAPNEKGVYVMKGIRLIGMLLLLVAAVGLAGCEEWDHGGGGHHGGHHSWSGPGFNELHK